MRISDWSSDVCSSDLIEHGAHDIGLESVDGQRHAAIAQGLDDRQQAGQFVGRRHRLGTRPGGLGAQVENKSEERRGGKECGSTCSSRGSLYHSKKKNTQTT